MLPMSQLHALFRNVSTPESANRAQSIWRVRHFQLPTSHNDRNVDIDNLLYTFCAILYGKTRLNIHEHSEYIRKLFVIHAY